MENKNMKDVVCLTAELNRLKAENQKLRGLVKEAYDEGYVDGDSLRVTGDWAYSRSRAELEEVEAGRGLDAAPWLDIGSAPKDRRILLCLGGGDWAIGSWNPNAFDGPRWEDDGMEAAMPFAIAPTHWMPLPQLPNGDV